jgi:hypothetical protein
MADLLISTGNAWLGTYGFGVRLKIFAQKVGMSPAQLAETPADNPGNGALGSGSYAPAYVPVNSKGLYKIWAEHPDNAGVKSNEDTYDFDYDAPNDPFNWNGNAVAAELFVPGIYFYISGRIKWIQGQSQITDWGHLVVSPQNQCDTSNSNRRIDINTGSGTVYTYYNGLVYAFRQNIGTDTFYVFFRDHNCNVVTEIRQITVSSGGSYSIGDLTSP